MLGLVLTAGGARGAYQAGVLKRVGEIPALRNQPSPFAIISGASAGGRDQRNDDRGPHLMDGLGTPNAQSADLMSYLLFDRSYTRALIDIGYHDAEARIGEIEAFLTA